MIFPTRERGRQGRRRRWSACSQNDHERISAALRVEADILRLFAFGGGFGSGL